MNWISEPLKIEEGGKYEVAFYAPQKICVAEVTFIKGFVEDDLGI